ncbi:MAG TPA: hypothetical protein DEF45_20665 [Rhodopirellula sp.]|nr:hypothetical protein [Rhodopirellula sp.]
MAGTAGEMPRSEVWDHQANRPLAWGGMSSRHCRNECGLHVPKAELKGSITEFYRSESSRQIGAGVVAFTFVSANDD